MRTQIFITIFFLIPCLFMSHAWADDIVGKWKAINDRTGVHEANILIYQNNDGSYDGKIEKIYDLPNGTPQKVEKCTQCAGELKDQPLIGLRILSHFTKHPKNPNEYVNGLVVDPETGKTYKGTIRMSPNGKKMTLNGYVGISLLGRTQTWIKSRDQ
ncbi:DUF2147 domain-containing protein [Acinetobacter sp. VNH17]|uniref:DUF2147 domain-containing protein n=1 Tax=Acinetobacter thutiue TaxID=2998078 RepID=A0ABT7WMX8_9GAMM|nr:DUF2147 domain-containing protein [Acinetobacter thutiue]MCY6411924.1 DUF2147 domain-containing protein [Acinetobacter thutiue]MDN0014028.1 DUF2147 domain-containing protein [Acinetobacter thutiue]